MKEEQKYANIFLHDMETGDVKIESRKTFYDYIIQYMSNEKNNRIHKLAADLGLDEKILKDLMSKKINEANINEYGRFDNLKKTVDIMKAKEYFETIEGKKIPIPKVNLKIDNLLRKFILSGGK